MVAIVRDSIKKRSVIIGGGLPALGGKLTSGHKTSVSLEDGFWNLLRRAALDRGIAVHQLVTQIDNDQTRTDNLSSALRLFVLDEAMAGRLTRESAVAATPDIAAESSATA